MNEKTVEQNNVEMKRTIVLIDKDKFEWNFDILPSQDEVVVFRTSDGKLRIFAYDPVITRERFWIMPVFSEKNFVIREEKEG
jgi:hypothetical protein